MKEIKGIKCDCSESEAIYCGSKCQAHYKSSKYYTPEIEEFRVGFEYEWYCTAFKKWKKMEFDVNTVESDADGSRIDNDGDAFNSWNYGNLERYRVKYLDREDIESLGFYFDKGSDYYWLRFFNGEYLLSIETEGRKIIIEKDGDNYFIGTIKNKSELKVLLKQLGI